MYVGVGVCLSGWLAGCPSVRPSAHMSVCPSVRLSVCPSVCLPVQLDLDVVPPIKSGNPKPVCFCSPPGPMSIKNYCDSSSSTSHYQTAIKLTVQREGFLADGVTNRVSGSREEKVVGQREIGSYSWTNLVRAPFFHATTTLIKTGAGLTKQGINWTCGGM